MTSHREDANSNFIDRDTSLKKPDLSISENQQLNSPADRSNSETNSSQQLSNSQKEKTIDSPQAMQTQQTQPTQTTKSQLKSILQSWQLWGILVVLASGSIGFTATSFLLKLPKTPDCANVFWPVASASMRLYCAQLEANKKTTDSLLAAIKLIEVLPKNHPLNDRVEHNAEKWAEEILKIGEQKFQQGNIKDSIEMAKKVPDHLEAYKLVDERVKKWESIWTEAENIYNKTDKSIRDANWNQAFLWAVQLTNVQNRYWATTKYEETVANIKLAQEENAKLEGAFAQLRRGGTDNILAAIAKAQEIREESYAYKQAQELIAKGKNKIVVDVEQHIAKRDWDRVLDIVNRLPVSLGLAQAADWNKLAGAGSSADLDTVTGFEDAIAQASQIEAQSPLYGKAQELISRWKLEIEDVARLAKARELAQPGNIPDFMNAIAEAKLIPANNPRYRDAQKAINDWNGEIKTIQDQPVLDRAQQIANGNSIEAWKQAIAEASVITPNSPLYDDTQKMMREWRGNIERIEDQPLVDQAQTLASQQDYAGAIEVAKQIKSGRILYEDVRGKIRGWRKEILAREYLSKAYQAAEANTPEGLSEAISLALQIASSTDLYSRSQQDINGWSERVLAFAREESNTSLENAINIAKTIPSGSSAYSSARSLVENWQRLLNSPEPEPETQPEPVESIQPLPSPDSEIPFDTSPTRRVPLLDR
jgi:hypothetical protein